MKNEKQMRIILSDALWNKETGTWGIDEKENKFIEKAIKLGYLTPNFHLITAKGVNHLIELQTK